MKVPRFEKVVVTAVVAPATAALMTPVGVLVTLSEAPWNWLVPPPVFHVPLLATVLLPVVPINASVLIALGTNPPKLTTPVIVPVLDENRWRAPCLDHERRRQTRAVLQCAGVVDGYRQRHDDEGRRRVGRDRREGVNAGLGAGYRRTLVDRNRRVAGDAGRIVNDPVSVVERINAKFQPST